MRSGPFRVAEYVKLANIEAFEKASALFETFLCFAPHAHDYIHTNESPGHTLTNFSYPRGKMFPVVSPVHQTEHLIAACLQGQMKMRRKAGGSSHKLNDLVAEQIGFQRRNPETFNALDSIQSPQQVYEFFAVAFTEISYVYTGQNDFTTAFGSHFEGLPNDFFDADIATSASGKRNGAIGTKIIATVLYFQKITGAVSAGAGRTKTVNPGVGARKHLGFF